MVNFYIQIFQAQVLKRFLAKSNTVHPEWLS